LSQLAFKKIDDEGTTLGGGNVNQTPCGRIVSIMVLDLVHIAYSIVICGFLVFYIKNPM